MDIPLLNRIKRKYIKTVKKLQKEIQEGKLDSELYINYMNQLYFINKSMNQLENHIIDLKKCIEKSKKKNQKNKIKDDKNEELMENSINTFKPFIFAHYFLNQES